MTTIKRLSKFFTDYEEKDITFYNSDYELLNNNISFYLEEVKEEPLPNFILQGYNTEEEINIYWKKYLSNIFNRLFDCCVEDLFYKEDNLLNDRQKQIRKIIRDKKEGSKIVAKRVSFVIGRYSFFLTQNEPSYSYQIHQDFTAWLREFELNYGVKR